MTLPRHEAAGPRPSPWRKLWRGLQKIDEASARTEADDLWDRIRRLEARVDALSLERPSSTLSDAAEPDRQQS